MHAEAYAHVQKTLEDQKVGGKRVLEIGAHNVNGTVRPLFDGAAFYTGIDVRSGPGVDVVADAAAYDPPEPVDYVVCCEVLEHAPDPESVIAAAWRALKPGGMLILTAAGPERAPHGNNGGDVGAEHYENIDPAQLRKWLHGWSEVRVTQNKAAGDVYAVAVKPADTKDKE